MDEVCSFVFLFPAFSCLLLQFCCGRKQVFAVQARLAQILPGSGHSLNSQRLASKSSTLKTKPATIISFQSELLTRATCATFKTHSKHHLSAPLGVERCFGFIETIPGAYTAERAWYLCAMTLGQRCLTLKETRPQKVTVSHRE